MDPLREAVVKWVADATAEPLGWSEPVLSGATDYASAIAPPKGRSHSLAGLVLNMVRDDDEVIFGELANGSDSGEAQSSTDAAKRDDAATVVDEVDLVSVASEQPSGDEVVNVDGLVGCFPTDAADADAAYGARSSHDGGDSRGKGNRGGGNQATGGGKGQKGGKKSETKKKRGTVRRGGKMRRQRGCTYRRCQKYKRQR